MKRTRRMKEWSVALFCTGLLFVFPPLVSIFDKPLLIFDLPLSYIVLYGFWIVVIACVAYGARSRRDANDPTLSAPPVNKQQGQG